MDIFTDIVGHCINSFESINGCCSDTSSNFNFKELFRSANPSIWNLVRVGMFSSKLCKSLVSQQVMLSSSDYYDRELLLWADDENTRLYH